MKMTTKESGSSAPAEPGGKANGVRRSLDEHGVTPIPDVDRDSTPAQVFIIWFGNNMAPINLILGALGIYFGLSFIQTVSVIVIGNLIGPAVFSLCGLLGYWTGINQLTLSRLAFGRRGAYLPAVIQLVATIGWTGVYTWVGLDLIVGILDRLDVQVGDYTRYAIACALMVVQLTLALLGFYVIRTFKKYTVPVAALVFVAMTILVFARVDVDFHRSELHTATDTIIAISQLTAIIGVGWSFSWVMWGADYTRFIKPSYSSVSVFFGQALGMAVSTSWLAAIGAALATVNDFASPTSLIGDVFGFMSIPALLALLYGTIGNNTINLYSSSMSLLSLDIRVARWKSALAVGLAAMAITLWFVAAESFATAFNEWLGAIVVVVSPWAALTLINYFMFPPRKTDLLRVVSEQPSKGRDNVNAATIAALVAGVVAGWCFLYGPIPALQGPLARLSGGLDLSWLVGFIVAGAAYFILNFRAASLARSERHSFASGAK
jgi:NCS1 family nucleobase:cation symporter-1